MLPLFLFAAATADSAVIEEIISLAGSYLDAKLGENQANARAVEPPRLRPHVERRRARSGWASAEVVSVTGLSIPLISQEVLPGCSGDVVGARA